MNSNLRPRVAINDTLDRLQEGGRCPEGPVFRVGAPSTRPVKSREVVYDDHQLQPLSHIVSR
jgi:hypothetical protein